MEVTSFTFLEIITANPIDLSLFLCSELQPLFFDALVLNCFPSYFTPQNVQKYRFNSRDYCMKIGDYVLCLCVYGILCFGFVCIIFIRNLLFRFANQKEYQNNRRRSKAKNNS